MAASKCNQMIKKITTLCALLFLATSLFAQDLVLKKGAILKKSVRVKKALYYFEGKKGQHAITIIGSNLIIDFAGAVITGAKRLNRPDSFAGVALIIKGGKNITVKNLTAKGYSIALVVKNVEGLKLENCNFSYNYRSNLKALAAADSVAPAGIIGLSDNEWKQPGIAMLLVDCNKPEIKFCTVKSGGHALMMLNCRNGLIYNNEFSFNSGIAIGGSGCMNNRILYNKLNFNLSSYSENPFALNLDCGGVVLNNWSRNNIIYKNLITHCQRGVLIMADGVGQDSACYFLDRNRVWNNDLSYAEGDGVRAFLASVHFADNRLYDCESGFSGSDAHNSIITGNRFRKNKKAIEIEHGQYNQLTNNLFLEDSEAIVLSGKSRGGQTDTCEHPSGFMNYELAFNSFNRNPVVYNFTNTDSLRIYGNIYGSCDTIFKNDISSLYVDTSARFLEDTAVGYPWVAQPIDPFKGSGKQAGRRFNVLTEWGPYNFEYPMLALESSGTNIQLVTLGPKGSWKIIDGGKFKIKPMKTDSSGSVFAIDRGSSPNEALSPGKITMEFTGAAFTDPYGKNVAARTPYRVIYEITNEELELVSRLLDPIETQPKTD